MKMHVLKAKISENINLVILWLLLTSAAPFTFFCLPGHPYKLLSAATLIVIFSMLFFKSSITQKMKIGHKPIIIIILLQVSFAFFSFFYHQDTYFINIITMYIAVLFSYLFISNFSSFKIFGNSFVFVLITMGIMGGIVFILAGIGLFKPFSTHINPDGRTAYNFILTFSNYIYILGKPIVVRVAGYFDEPGTLAFYLIYALIINKLVFDNRKTEILIVIGGLFTLSMMFYFSLFVYYFMFYFRFKNFKASLIVFLFLFIIIFYLTNSNDRYTSLLYRFTIDRFSVSNQSGQILKGDNRSELFKRSIKYFMEAPIMGNGPTYTEERLPFMGANIFGVFAIFGITGFFFIFLPVIYLGIISLQPINAIHDLKTIKLLLLLLLQYVQRPDLLGMFNYLALLVVIEFVLMRRNQLRVKYASFKR
jgi:hypothetical protein